jgi:hypothetical protein
MILIRRHSAEAGECNLLWFYYETLDKDILMILIRRHSTDAGECNLLWFYYEPLDKDI